MMEKDTKRSWHLPYCFLEPEKLEREFARLAAQGWLLEKCTYGTYTYRTLGIYENELIHPDLSTPSDSVQIPE